MNTPRIRLMASLVAAGFLIASGVCAQAQTVIYTDNFDIPNTASLDGSTQTGRHTGILSNNVVGRSGGIQHTITSSNLNLLAKTVGTATGRMRLHDAANTANRWNWASGTAGTQILTDGGMKISFDWTAADNTSANWISYCVGIPTTTDPDIRIIEAGTDGGILLRNNGGAQVFKSGSGGATATFNVTSLTRHVDLNYAFTSWADGASVTFSAYVNNVLVISTNFTWSGQAGVHHMEIASIANGTKIDNYTVASFAPPPFLTVSAVSDSPASNYVGRTINLIGTVGGTLPRTNQWKVDKGSGFVNVANATNTTLQLSNVQVSDSGSYALYVSNAAGTSNSVPLAVTVLPASTNTTLNVQFRGGGFGSGLAPVQSGAAVTGNAGDVWNGISNTTGGTSPAGLANASGLSLVDISNVATTVTLDYVGDYLFNGAAFGFTFPFAGTPVANLMQGYMGSVSNGGNPDTNRITLHNLTPGAYDLYLYSAARSDGQSRLAVFAANASTAVCGPNSGVTNLVAGTNYVHLTPIVGGDGLLTISYYGTADAGQSQMNGLQLNGPVTLPTLFLSTDTTSDSPATNYAGRTVLLTASFSGNPSPVYQWKVNQGGGFVNVSASATNASLTLNNVQTANSGSYALFASNVVGVSNSTPLTLTVLPAPATNLAVNVQFVGTSLGSGFAVTQVGGAVIGSAGHLWNPVSNPNPIGGDTNPISGSGLRLSDAAGIGTTITLGYTGKTILNSGAATPFNGSGSPAANLMQACLGVVNSDTGTVTVQGLLPRTYDLYLYSSAGNGGQARVSQFTANGASAAAGPNNGTNVLIAGTNYVHLSPVVASNGVLNISLVATGGDGQASLNGLQLFYANHPPVAQDITLGAALGETVSFPVIGGKFGPTDADGDSATVTAVGVASSGTSGFTASNITYFANGSLGTNPFSYTVTDALGATDTRMVAVIVYSPQGFNRLSPPDVIGPGEVALSFLGIPGVAYALDHATNLTPPIVWTPVITNTAATNGWLNFTNTSSAAENYFRTRHVP